MRAWIEKLFYKLVWRLVWIFYPSYTIEGRENLPEEPSIVVGNHSQAHGPIFSELYFPGKRSIWCAGQMMRCSEVPDYTYHDFWDEKPRYLHPLFRLLSYIIAPFISAVMRCGDTIAVYHDTRVIHTFRTTITKLTEGNHIIIFPECKRGYNQILCAFQENFIDVAKQRGLFRSLVSGAQAAESLFWQAHPIRQHGTHCRREKTDLQGFDGRHYRHGGFSAGAYCGALPQYPQKRLPHKSFNRGDYP